MDNTHNTATRFSSVLPKARGFLTLLLLATVPAFGVTNILQSVSLSTAVQGANSLLVTFTLNTTPPPPPTNVPISCVMIGSIAGTVSPHTNQYILSALFNIPGGEAPGRKDVTITFPGSFVGYKAAGFTVTAASNVVADFAAFPTNGTPPLTVNFTDASAGPVTNRLWDFGDGSTSTETNPVHTNYFGFTYGGNSTKVGSRIIDAQDWSANYYVSTVMSGQAAAFGYNFTDGRIKGYPPANGNYIRYVRGNPDYGINQQLATNRQPHIFTFGHEPAFKAFHTDCLDDYPTERNAFWNSLAASGAKVYLCGHDHFFNVARIGDGDGNATNDLYQFIVGTGGSTNWPPQRYSYNGTNSPYTPVNITSNATSCATCDPDNDTSDNFSEYVANTNPTNALSYFHIESIVSEPNLTVSVPSSASRVYTLYYRTNLTSGDWTNIPSQTDIPGSGGLDTRTDFSPADTQRFYRLGVSLP